MRRGAVDAEAVRTVIRLLRGGEALLMFPEGTRTRDGDFGRFSPGAAALAARCKVPLLPVCIEGAYRAWPRVRPLPKASPMAVAFGEPMATGGQSGEELTRRRARGDAGVARIRARAPELAHALKGGPPRGPPR